VKYLCLVYFEEKTMKAMSKDQWDSLNDECIACGAGLRSSGHFLGGEALHSVDTATTLRVRGGKVSTTDGPFAETKEFLGGFLLIEARDLNQALNLAAGVPVGKVGKVEVRPLWDISESL